MKKHELKQLIREQILAELEPIAINSQIYGITVDGERIKFELDENSILDGSYKNLKTLVVNDPRVTRIHCGMNQLTTLKLGKLPNLLHLFCSSNQLTTLDVSNCPNLDYLDCGRNQLTTLKLGKLPNLRTVHCTFNKLTSLDVSGCPNLEQLNYNKSKTKLIK